MKKIFFLIFYLILIVYACVFPEPTVSAARDGLLIWSNQILPALLPFTILSGLLIHSGFLHSFKRNEKLIAIALTMCSGFAFGFPIGAKLSADFYKQGLLSQRQAICLCITTNNFSPMYVGGFVLPLLFDSSHYNTITYILLYLLPLFIAGAIILAQFSCKRYISSIDTKYPREFHIDMQIFNESILNGFASLLKICGYIVLFSVLNQILANMWDNAPFLWHMIVGNMEITNGIQLLSKWQLSEDIRYILTIQLLAFGGISGIFQTGSVLSGSGISLRKYTIGKVLLSLLSTLLAAAYVFFIRLI